MLKKKLKVFIIILEDLRGAYIMITSMLKVQDFKNVWKDYRTICIIAVAVVAVLLLLFIIEAVRAHKKAKAFKNQLSENKKLSREVEDLKANQNTDAEVETSTSNEGVTEEPQAEEVAILEESQVEEVKSEDTATVLAESETVEPIEEEVEEETQEESTEETLETTAENVQNDEEKNENEEVVEDASDPVVEDVKETTAIESNEEVAAEEPKEEVIVEEPKEEVIVEEPKENTLEEVKEEPVEQPAKSVKKAAVKKVKAEKPANETTEEPKKTNRAKGKYEIVQDATGFKYYLKASNGETLIVSESYTSLLGCKNAIKRLKENTLTATIKVEEDKNHNFQFHVVKGTRVVAHSANYNTKISAQNASKAFAKYVNTDVIKLQEESKNDLELVTLDDAQISTETVGKILVSKENDMFLYKLIANNGQTICMSATYKTMVTIQKSIESFRDAVYDGKFYIQKDKNDKYQFKLYNKASRLIMTGESFQNADSCRSNILSCYRFAKNAPIEYTDEAVQK